MSASKKAAMLLTAWRARRETANGSAMSGRASGNVSSETVASGNDAALLARARTGERAALDALLSPHETMLYRVCYGMLGNDADAEDASQETLLLAVRALTRDGGFRGDSSLKTWLVRIAKNTCVSRLRRKRDTLSLDSLVEDSGDSAISGAAALSEAHGSSPESLVLDRMFLKMALDRLTPGQRAALILQAVDGLSVREIAQSLEVSEKKVDNDLYRARCALAKFREEMERDGNA